MKASNNVSRANLVQIGDVDGTGVVAASLHEGENAGAEPSHPNAAAKATAIKAATLLHRLDIDSDMDTANANSGRRQSRRIGGRLAYSPTAASPPVGGRQTFKVPRVTAGNAISPVAFMPQYSASGHR